MKKDWSKMTDQEKDAERRRNNPAAQPTGDYTGRCKRCGSANLWDDNLAYGCNDCGAFLRGN